VDYILHIEVSEDGEPTATLEEFHGYAEEQRAKKATLARQRKLARDAEKAKAKAEAEKLAAQEAERQADITHLNEMTASAERLVAEVASLRTPGSMVGYQESRNAYFGAERMLHAAAAFARTKGIEEPAILRSLTAKLGPCKVRLGA
jgi:flagellum-specific peptidoglycan hydrolase FlgJ